MKFPDNITQEDVFEIFNGSKRLVSSMVGLISAQIDEGVPMEQIFMETAQTFSDFDQMPLEQGEDPLDAVATMEVGKSGIAAMALIIVTRAFRRDTGKSMDSPDFTLPFQDPV